MPLTEAFEELNINRFLLTEGFYNILTKQAQLLLKLANEREAERTKELEREYLMTQDEFIVAMNREFEINQITYRMGP